ncbi:MAG: Transglutaminase family protein [Candidatus Gottesmanbacteria bacterium GW2011_GWA2_47_9]|uniref:Transglutaminase family protein n=1 Tax=Candidatus Gottesmanbacteria bacterium GW2011_GWA2_47_9 TaxID=1618445 RepID=A0A0G1WYK5_9BACT|nr:MAG: Transglutaminase family protein [Candidatus Gottesmanbacteria bacterium GW2011_GWA2_47_9]
MTTGHADYDVAYAIAPTGTTIVTQSVILTNNLTNLYPQKYSILIDSEKIKNVIAYDKQGQITPAITQTDGKTEILLTFNDKVVGVGKSMTFTLRFENGDIAQKNGAIWEVNIPGAPADADIASYDVSLTVPSAFGSNAYMTPLPANGTKWIRDQMVAGGISAAYGETQYFDMELSYHLENPRVTPESIDIALPPDTAHQTVTITSLDPKPTTVTRDPDGNWLARYTLNPGENIDVTARLTASIALLPKDGYTDSITREEYLKADQYWETTDPAIISLANEYRTPRAIYDYVVSKLSYDYNRVNQNPIRKGAAQALATPAQSICMEFTDLFIAIARAAGIPAREVVGYAYTTNSKLRPLSLVTDVLHAWPEYFDEERSVWVPVDPTWAKTTGGINYFDKLDFNHIAFAIHGVSSRTPYPAGSYRKEGKAGKDVRVGFGSPPEAPAMGELTTRIEMPKRVIGGVTTQGQAIIENSSGVAVSDVSVSIQSTPVDVAIYRQKKSIPPYGSLQIPITLTVPNMWRKSQGRISAEVNGTTTHFAFDIQPVYFMMLPVALVSLLIFLLIAIAVMKPPFLWNIFKKP